MCTASIVPLGDGFRFAFNRDERRWVMSGCGPPAEPPGARLSRGHGSRGISVIEPVDCRHGWAIMPARQSLPAGSCCVGGALSAAVRQEHRGFGPSKIVIQNRDVHGGQVHHHQGIQRIAKAGIDVEPEQRRVQSQVLSQQNRHALTVRFRGRDQPVDLVDRSGRDGRDCIRNTRMHGFDELRQIGVQPYRDSSHDLLMAFLHQNRDEDLVFAARDQAALPRELFNLGLNEISLSLVG